MIPTIRHSGKGKNYGDGIFKNDINELIYKTEIDSQT